MSNIRLHPEGAIIIPGKGREKELAEVIQDDDTILVKRGIEALSHYDLFKVTPRYIYTPKDGEHDEEGEQLPPIKLIICSPFMAKEGWILDFGVGIIYKLQANYG